MNETTADLYGPSRSLVEQTLSRVERLPFHQVYMSLRDSLKHLTQMYDSIPETILTPQATPTKYSILRHLHTNDATLRVKLDALLSLPSHALDKRAFEGEWCALIHTEILRKQFHESYALSLFVVDSAQSYALHDLISQEMKADFLREPGVITHVD